MSFTDDGAILCDGATPTGAACSNWSDRVHGHRPPHLARKVRAAAHRDGWATGLPGSRDLCPYHASLEGASRKRPAPLSEYAANDPDENWDARP